MEKLNIKKIMNRIKSLSLENKILLLLASPFNFVFYYLVSYLTKARFHYYLITPIDEVVPFVPWTMIIYWGCYIFWIINYCLCTIYDKGINSQFIKTHYIGETICFIIMFTFPTIMSRPVITSTDIFSKMLSIQYAFDAADNLFPSIHCFVSYLCWIGVRNNDSIPKWYQNTSLVLALLVFISTLTVKQHVLVDLFASVLVAEASYKISAYLSSRKNIFDMHIIKINEH